MEAEQDPAELFPPNFYDRMKRLAAQDHPELREAARVELNSWIEKFTPKDDPTTETIKKRRRVSLMAGTLIITGGYFLLDGIKDKNPAGISLGGSLIGIALIEPKARREETQDSLASRQAKALRALIAQPTEQENGEESG